MTETLEQFLAACGKYRRVSDIPEAERKAMLERINVDEIDRHRRDARERSRRKRACPES